MYRRRFLESLLLGQSLLIFQGNLKSAPTAHDYWLEIRNQFPISNTDYINLNNASCGMTPLVVEDTLTQQLKEMNRKPPYVQHELWKELMIETKLNLGHLIGVNSEELAITRNTTESLQWIIGGLEIPENSSIVCASHDYSLALNALKAKAADVGSNLIQLDLSLPMEAADIISAYDKVITDQCALVLITSMTHREGHRMPVKEITARAHAKGAQVLVDAAHSFGHYSHNVAEWNCDYYVSSLHKWFNGPRGTGLLYAKKGSLENISGPLAADFNQKSNINMFDYLGTRAFYIEASIASAVAFNKSIGLDNKYSRLCALSEYWTLNAETIQDVETIKCKDSGGVAGLFVEGMSGGKMVKKLKEKNIYTKAVRLNGKKMAGIRVSPGIYSNEEDLDAFLSALETIIKER